MNNKKMFKMSWKQLFSIILVVVLIAGLCPQYLKAEDTTPVGGIRCQINQK